jgi:hypothetical protein
MFQSDSQGLRPKKVFEAPITLYTKIMRVVGCQFLIVASDSVNERCHHPNEKRSRGQLHRPREARLRVAQAECDAQRKPGFA